MQTRIQWILFPVLDYERACQFIVEKVEKNPQKIFLLVAMNLCQYFFYQKLFSIRMGNCFYLLVHCFPRNLFELINYVQFCEDADMYEFIVGDFDECLNYQLEEYRIEENLRGILSNNIKGTILIPWKGVINEDSLRERINLLGLEDESALWISEKSCDCKGNGQVLPRHSYWIEELKRSVIRDWRKGRKILVIINNDWVLSQLAIALEVAGAKGVLMRKRDLKTEWKNKLGHNHLLLTEQDDFFLSVYPMRKSMLAYFWKDAPKKVKVWYKMFSVKGQEARKGWDVFPLL